MKISMLVNVGLFTIASGACGNDDGRQASTQAVASEVTASAASTETDTGVGVTTGTASEVSGEPTSTGSSGSTETGGASSTAGVSSTGGESSTGAAACVPKLYPNALVKRPVDVLLYIDGSGSMAGVIADIKAKISGALFTTLEAEGVDYTVTVIALYPGVCIDWNGQVDCAAPEPPVIPGHFYQGSIGTASSGVPDHFEQVIADPWMGWWRPEAYKVVVGMTDGENSPNNPDGAAAFQLVLDGLMGADNYTVHTVSGLLPAAAILQPDQPLANGACNGDDESGPALKAQQLSIDTGGLRASVCGFDAQPIFTAIAQSSITSAIPCELTIPDTEPDDVIDPANLDVRFDPGNGDPPIELMPVADANACVGLAYYLEGNVVHLCPEACAAIKADPNGALELEHCVLPG
jgi:hypothetical protein